MKYLPALLMVVVLVLVLSPPGAAQTTVKQKYGVVVVERFEFDEELGLPVDYQVGLQEEILKQMREAKLFAEVLRAGETPAKEGALVLRVSGRITRFKAGSRAQRYLGVGVGSTEIFAHLVYVDHATSRAVITDDVHGAVRSGFLGGDSRGVTRDFACNVVTSAKVIVHKQIGESAAVADAPPPAVDQQTIEFNSHDFEGTQGRLNGKGAAGYRLADFLVTGSDSADVVMASAGPSEIKYEYRVIHTRLPGTMQKEMNQAAGEGFRLCGQTVGQFGGVMTTIMQRASDAPSAARYTYRVHQTFRVSSAEKDTKNDQAEGYELAGASHQTVHLVVLEKEIRQP